MEEAVLEMNARFFRFDLSGLAVLQYALYGGPEGGHFDWHKDYGRDPSDPAQEPRKLTLSLQLSEAVRLQGLRTAGPRRQPDRHRAAGARHPGRLSRQCAAPGDAD